MKKITLVAAGLVLANTTFAQTLQDAITKTDNERYAAAAADFRALIAKEAAKGDNYFYYGENFFKKGDLDSANMYYQKGVEVNATYPLNYVGLGKVLWYKGNSADAKTQFFKASELGLKKNTEVMRKTAETYINADNKNLDEAINLLNAAIKIEPKNAENHLLMGDALLEKNPTEGGPAIKEYDKFTELNPKSPKGILRAGKLYQRGRNYQLALDLYKKAEGIDATYAPAYREKAELYHLAGQKANAVESYKKYLELNNSEEARERYAGFLLNNKQYSDAISEIEKLQSAGNKSMYLDRYLGYSYAELPGKVDTAAYRKGLNAISKFFDKSAATPNFKYLATDYKYKGLLLAKLGKDSLGIIEMEKAIAQDPKMTNDILREVAKAYLKSKKYAKAIETYEKIMGGDPKNLSGQDYFEMGRAYYFGPKDFVKSDTCFSKVTQSIPTFATAYFWRGKANVQQDPKNEKWLAKPHYEKALVLSGIIGNSIKLEKSGGVFLVPCKVNDLPLNFIFDTGASDVTISLTEANFMLKNGQLKREDVIGKQLNQDATGNITVGSKIILRKLEVGNKVVTNVDASVIETANAPLLLGQTALAKFGNFNFDPNAGVLTFLNQKGNVEASSKANVIEACEYLGYYYLTVKDNAKAKEYFTIIKDLDPNNKKQVEFFKSPAGK